MSPFGRCVPGKGKPNGARADGGPVKDPQWIALRLKLRISPPLDKCGNVVLLCTTLHYGGEREAPRFSFSYRLTFLRERALSCYSAGQKLESLAREDRGAVR